jgi:hypothetical protein
MVVSAATARLIADCARALPGMPDACAKDGLGVPVAERRVLTGLDPPTSRGDSRAGPHIVAGPVSGG